MSIARSSSGDGNRRGLGRPARLFAVLGAVVAALVCAALWITAPSRRREVLFEAPIRLKAGAVATGSFEPEHEGPYRIEVRFPQVASSDAAARQALGEAVGGDWSVGAQASGFAAPSIISRPPGFSASYVVKARGVPVAGGATGENLETDYHRGEAAVTLAEMNDGRPIPLDFEVRVDRAVEGLAAWDARLVVAASGDWIHYASLESSARLALVVVVALVALLATLIVRLIRSRRQARGTLSATSGDSGR